MLPLPGTHHPTIPAGFRAPGEQEKGLMSPNDKALDQRSLQMRTHHSASGTPITHPAPADLS